MVVHQLENNMGQLEKLTFDEILRKYPERNLDLSSVGYKGMTTNARRTKPLSAAQARNFVITATGLPEFYDANKELVFPATIETPLRAYVVGIMDGDDENALSVIGNVTVPSGARVREKLVRLVRGGRMLNIPSFCVNTLDLDSAVRLHSHRRYMEQVGGVLVVSPDVLGGRVQLWLGMNTSVPGRAFRFFVDQGNALRYAGIKR